MALFLLFTLAWTYYSGIQLLGAVLGDCFEDQRCWGIKAYAPGFVLWRWLAVQLAAVIGLILVWRRTARKGT